MIGALQTLAQYSIFGIVEASILAPPAIALTLVYDILGYPNFAIGDIVTFGAYLIYALNSVGRMPLPAAFLVAGALYAVLLVAVDQGVFRPVRNRGIFPPILLSIGLIFLFQNAVRFIWGNGIREFDYPVTPPLQFAGLHVAVYQLLIVGAVFVLVVLLHLLLRYTRLGKAIRATASNPNLAVVCGIDREKVARLIWVAGGFLVALSGGFLGLNASLSPLMGWDILLPVYAVAIVGGVGSVYGAVIGAVIVGVVEELSVLFIPDSYKAVMAFFILVVVLLLRPTGIIGKVRRV